MIAGPRPERTRAFLVHEMEAAKLPVHCDLVGFDFEVSPVDRKLMGPLATTAFADEAHNVELDELG